jgi:hypothetical protein
MLKINAHGLKTFIAAVQLTLPMNDIDQWKAIKKRQTR